MRRGNALATQTKAVQTIHCWDPSSAAAQKKSASGGTSRNRRGRPFEIRQVATIPVPNSRQHNRSVSLTAVQTVQPNNTGPLGVHMQKQFKIWTHQVLDCVLQAGRLTRLLRMGGPSRQS